MTLLFGESLVMALRTLVDKSTKRLWIAVPYIGSPISIRKILGKQWHDNPSVSVRLLTDASDLSCIDSETMEIFYRRGEVRTLLGLHAKIYVVDDVCLVTSANLTSTAFSRRYEVGTLFNAAESKEIISMFNKKWWTIATVVDNRNFKRVIKDKHPSNEERATSLPLLNSLPKDPGSLVKKLDKKFLNYPRLLLEYEDFSKCYSSIQRIWPTKPLYFEIDGLFDFLYHIAPSTPSKKYEKRKPRNLSLTERNNEIEKWGTLYRKWNDKRLREGRGDDIEWRLQRSKTIRQLLKPNKVMTLSKKELWTVFSCLNSMISLPINRTKILNNNSLSTIRKSLDQLVNGMDELPIRMTLCNELKNIGASSMNEIIGFANPNKYPLINKNSNCGLRFFGYEVKPYS